MLVGVLTFSSTAVGLSVAAASSSAPALDSSVVGTLVFPTSANIPGGGSPAGHGANSIEVSSWSFGTSNPTGLILRKAGGGGITLRKSGGVQGDSITVTKSVDQASPVLFRNCVAGSHYPTVVLYLDEQPAGTGATGAPTYTNYITITLKNAYIASDVISSGAPASGGGDDNPKESVSLNFTKVTMTYDAPGTAATSVSWSSSTK